MKPSILPSVACLLGLAFWMEKSSEEASKQMHIPKGMMDKLKKTNESEPHSCAYPEDDTWNSCAYPEDAPWHKNAPWRAHSDPQNIAARLVDNLQPHKDMFERWSPVSVSEEEHATVSSHQEQIEELTDDQLLKDLLVKKGEDGNMINKSYEEILEGLEALPAAKKT